MSGNQAGGGEDGLAEAFEDGRDLFQPLLAGVDFCQEFFQLGDDAALFIQGRNRSVSVFSRLTLKAGWAVAEVISAILF